MDKFNRRKFIRRAAASFTAIYLLNEQTQAAQKTGPKMKPTFEALTEEIKGKRGPKIREDCYRDIYIENKFVKENQFFWLPRETTPLPTFEDSKHLLPKPLWSANPTAIGCYWKAWQLAFKNLRPATPENGFVANYIDPAFNQCTFMWDSVFMTLFGRYGRDTFNFLRILDNFYCKQHKDGFICRQLRRETGHDEFFRFDPVGTGPNVLAWAEWEFFLTRGDKERLANVFPVLVAYHQWTRLYRTWKDGSYWNSGWGSGMDNQPRFDFLKEYQHLYHGYTSWVDANMQAILSTRMLMNMAQVLNRINDIPDITQEHAFLYKWINNNMWDVKSQFYYDVMRDGRTNGVKTIGAYWALLSDVIPPDRRQPFISHLENEKEFNRPHRVPTLSADHPDYDPVKGGYWRGAIWPPTNYMVLSGLTKNGNDDLAYDIAKSHLENVWQVFKETGTVWENYAPESASPGGAKPDFVGWSGLPPIAVFFEYIIGLRPDVSNHKLLWDIRLTDEHGVNQYPFGSNGLINLKVEKRDSEKEEPCVQISSNVPVNLEIHWKNGKKLLKVQGS